MADKDGSQEQQDDVQLTDSEAFDAAWEGEDEQDTGDGPGDQSDQNSGDENDEEGAWQEDDDTPKADQGKDDAGDDQGDAGTGDDTGEGEAADQSGGEQANDQGDQGEVDWKARFEQLEQKTKSWEGRLSAVARENDELKRQLAEARPGKSGGDDSGDDASESSGNGDSDSEALDAANAALSEFFEEYPDLKAPLQTLVSQAVSQAEQRVEEKFKPVLSKVEEEAQRTEQERAEAHEKAVLEAHPDVYELSSSPDMEAWLAELPPYRQNIAKAVMQEGDTQDVIELLNDYKAARGIKTQQRSGDTDKQDNDGDSKAEAIRRRREQQADDAQVVKSGRAHVPRGKPSPDDFDSAWDEAISN